MSLRLRYGLFWRDSTWRPTRETVRDVTDALLIVSAILWLGYTVFAIEGML